MAVLHLLFIYAQKVVEIVESDRVATPKSPKFSLKMKNVKSPNVFQKSVTTRISSLKPRKISLPYLGLLPHFLSQSC